MEIHVGAGVNAPGGPNSERLNEMGKAYNWKKSGFKSCETLSEFKKLFIKQEMFVQIPTPTDAYLDSRIFFSSFE